MAVHGPAAPGTYGKPREAAVSGRLTVFVAPKGGVGRTFLAVNAAVAAAVGGEAVTLLDLDLRGGDAALHLNLLSAPGLEEVVSLAEVADVAPWWRGLISHAPSGLSFLRGPSHPEWSGLLSPEAVACLVSWARHRAGPVVADTGPDLWDRRLWPCLQGADRVLLVVDPDAAAVRRARLARDLLADLGLVETGRVALICNRVRKDMPFTTGGLARVLDLPLAGAIPELPGLALASVWRGRPLALTREAEDLVATLRGLITAHCGGE